MIIINDELLLKVFGKERVPYCKDILMHSLNELIKREAYGNDITEISIYEPQWDPQKYVDNWMNSTIAKTEVAEYYKELSFKGEDNMNKYETLLKKYGKLCREFEAYKEVTEDIADKGTYITNEALEELKECKKKYDTLFKEHKAYCYASEDVAVKLIETEKKYDELEKERDALVQEVYHLHDVIRTRQEQCKSLTRERDGIKKENEALYKEFKELKKERENLAQQVVYLNDKMKEKMDKIKHRDKQITELVNRRNEKDKQMTDLIKERDALKTLYTETAKERDEYEKRLEHINTMSNLEWKFEVVEETETTRSPWDELVDTCASRHGSCFGCPKGKNCEMFFSTPLKWTEEQIKEYNNANTETAVSSYDRLVEFCENRTEGCSGCPNEIACDGINMSLKPAKWNEDEKAEYNELMAMKED